MRKRFKVGFWLLILLLLLATGSTYLRFKVPECQYTQTNQNTYDIALKCAEGGLERFLTLFEDWDSERTIALFTVLLVLATFFLWKATRDLVTGAEKTAQKQLRAYVGIDYVSVKVLEIGKKPRVDWFRKNYGQTPASRFRLWIELEILPNEDTIASFPQQFGDYDVGSINASAGLRNECSGDDEITADQLQGINSRELTLYFFGAFKYFDVFGCEQTTEFRLYYIPPFVEGKGMALSRKGNRAT